MKTAKTLLIIIIATSFTSCGELHCPAFPKEVRDCYFPYSAGELLTFTNSQNDTLEIKINNTYLSDNSYSYPRNCDCWCGADARFDTETTTNFSLNINGSIHLSTESDRAQTRVYYLLCEFSHRDEFATEKYHFTGKEKEPAIFGDTIFLEKQEYNRIGSVKIVKNKGIVEFWDKQQNCNWVIVQ